MKKKGTERYTAARCTLVLMASGLRPSGIRVRDIAESVGAPRMAWKSRMLIRWLDDRLSLTA